MYTKTKETNGETRFSQMVFYVPTLHNSYIFCVDMYEMFGISFVRRASHY